MIKIKKLFIVVICLLAVALSAISCSNSEDLASHANSDNENEEKQEQKESPYKKITARSYTMSEKPITFIDADDYKSGMAEYIAKYKSEELLGFIVKVDFSPDYDTKKLNIIEYLDKQNNDESCITYTVALEKFDPELLVKLCENVISIDVFPFEILDNVPT